MTCGISHISRTPPFFFLRLFPLQVLRGSHSSYQLSKLANSSGWRTQKSYPAFCWNLHGTFKRHHPTSSQELLASHVLGSGTPLAVIFSPTSHTSRLSTLIPCTPLRPSLDTLSLVEGIGAQNPRLQPPGSHHGDTEDMSSVIGPCGCVSWCLCNVSAVRLGYQPNSHDDSTSIWPSSNSREETVGYKTPQSCMVSRDSGARQQSFPSGYTHLRFFWSSGWHRGRPQPPPPAGFGSRKDVLISEFMSYRGAV